MKTATSQIDERGHDDGDDHNADTPTSLLVLVSGEPLEEEENAKNPASSYCVKAYPHLFTCCKEWSHGSHWDQPALLLSLLCVLAQIAVLAPSRGALSCSAALFAGRGSNSHAVNFSLMPAGVTRFPRRAGRAPQRIPGGGRAEDFAAKVGYPQRSGPPWLPPCAIHEPAAAYTQPRPRPSSTEPPPPLRLPRWRPRLRLYRPTHPSTPSHSPSNVGGGHRGVGRSDAPVVEHP
jgi:hypothetical protein